MDLRANFGLTSNSMAPLIYPREQILCSWHYVRFRRTFLRGAVIKLSLTNVPNLIFSLPFHILKNQFSIKIMFVTNPKITGLTGLLFPKEAFKLI